MRKHERPGTVDLDISSQPPFGKKTSQTTIPHFHEKPQSKKNPPSPKPQANQSPKPLTNTSYTSPPLSTHNRLHSTPHPSPPQHPHIPPSPTPQQAQPSRTHPRSSAQYPQTHFATGFSFHQFSDAFTLDGCRNGETLDCSVPGPIPNIAMKICGVSWVVRRSL